MKRRRVVVAAFLFLGLLAVAALVVASRPFVRARWHLLRALSTDVHFEEDRVRFTGEARAFLDSSSARALLPQLTSLAERECDEDQEFVFRALYLELALGTRAEPRPLDESGGRLLVRLLSSRSTPLREATLVRLPLDDRFQAAVAARFADPPRGPARTDAEEKAARDWMIDLNCTGLGEHHPRR